MNELVVTDRHGRVLPSSAYTKADPPKLGEKFGAGWAGEGKIRMQLPGGGMLLFDLDRLTLQDFRAMRNHYQINISLSLLSFMVHQVPWRIEGGDEKARAFVEDNMREVWTRMVRAISPAFWAGYAPVILQFENDRSDGKIRITKFKDVEPEWACVNWKNVDGYAPPGAVKPKIKVFDGMNIIGQQGPIPPENVLWYPLLMEAGDHYGRKLLKPAFPSWFFSQIIHLYVNRYFERFGEPVPIGRAPFDRNEPDGQGGTVNGKEVMENILSAMRSRASVVLPNDKIIDSVSGGKQDYEYQIEYLESQMRGADFERYLSRLDEEMSLGIFTPVLLYRTADVGSYNLGEAHERMFLIMTNSLIGDLAEYINRYVINRLVDFNFGPNARKGIRLVPHMMGNQAQATLAQLAAGLIQGGYAIPDLRELGLSIGLTLHQVDTLVATNEETTTETESVAPPAPKPVVVQGNGDNKPADNKPVASHAAPPSDKAPKAGPPDNSKGGTPPKPGDNQDQGPQHSSSKATASKAGTTRTVHNLLTDQPG